MTIAKTMFDKVWAEHKVAELGSDYELVHIDRCFIHDLSGPISLNDLKKRELSVLNPSLVYATPDHLVSSDPGNGGANDPMRGKFIDILRKECDSQNIALFDTDNIKQGIVHVVGPALGLSLPGTTIVCGDSHTCTHGGVGAIAWGVGNSELTHSLATQCLIEKRPKTMLLKFVGELPEQVSAKDLILSVIGRFGSDLGEGYALEYAGSPIEKLSIEERLTICNLTVELGAKIGFVAPDEKTVTYLHDLEYSPKGKAFNLAAEHWLSLRSDDGAQFDKTIEINVGDLQPQISWGINPEHTIGITDEIPDPKFAPNENTKDAWSQALDYMGLKAGDKIEGAKVDQVFIGSCANSRLSDLQSAAALLVGRRVAEGVEAWVVPGSQQVKKIAEDLGLDKLFVDAGFQWREPGCSLCPAANGDFVAPEKRCISTSNRNFIGRQGPQARTHLASPEVAVAAAIFGKITDPRSLMAK